MTYKHKSYQKQNIWITHWLYEGAVKHLIFSSSLKKINNILYALL